MTSTTFLSTDVGIGSAAENLSGSRRTASMTSSVVSGEKQCKDAPGRAWLNDAGGALLHGIQSYAGNFLSEKLIERFNVDSRALRYTAAAKQVVDQPP